MAPSSAAAAAVCPGAVRGPWIWGVVLGGARPLSPALESCSLFPRHGTGRDEAQRGAERGLESPAPQALRRWWKGGGCRRAAPCVLPDVAAGCPHSAPTPQARHEFALPPTPWPGPSTLAACAPHSLALAALPRLSASPQRPTPPTPGKLEPTDSSSTFFSLHHVASALAGLGVPTWPEVYLPGSIFAVPLSWHPRPGVGEPHPFGGWVWEGGGDSHPYCFPAPLIGLHALG